MLGSDRAEQYDIRAQDKPSKAMIPKPAWPQALFPQLRSESGTFESGRLSFLREVKREDRGLRYLRDAAALDAEGAKD